MLNIWMQRNGAGLLSLQLLPAVCAPADGTPLPLRALSLGCVTTQKGVSSRSDVTSLAAGDSAAYCPTARQWRANSLTHPRRGSCFFIFLLHSGDIMPCCSITLSLLFKYSHHKAKAWPGKPVWGGPSDLHGPPQRALTWPEGHAPPEAQNTQHDKGPPSSPWPTRLKRGALSHLNHSIISSNAAPTLLIQPWGILHAIRLPRTKVINVMLQRQNAWRHAERAISYPLANR